MVMATDKHYNEPGVMPEVLRDRKGTDMPATRTMFFVILAVAIIALVGFLVIRLIG
jgi:uncharacterized membrane protein